MAIDDMACPNCGASVDFAGSTRAICSFCKSQLYLTDDGVEASSVRHDLLENQPATRGVDVPVVTIDQQRNSLAASSSRRTTFPKLGCLGCLPTLLFIGMCAGFIMLSSQVMFRALGPLDQALQIINSDPAVVQAFGKPITPGPFVTGKISGGDTSSLARFSVPIYGPKRTGHLQVSGSWRKGIWDLSVYVVYEEDGEEQTIQITQKVK